MKKEDVIKIFNLKKTETIALNQFISELKKINPSRNLVGKSTLLNPWDRHICDSLQIMSFIKNKNSSILDMGTGAGLPGIALSILGYKNITMIDSRKKKTEFVKQIIEKLGLKAKIIHSRLEDMHLPPFQYITSRALASLDRLLNYSLFFSNDKTRLIFLKGKNVNIEILESKKKFFFDYKIYESKSSGGGFVVKIKDFKIND
ncbi:uncharacterized protein METZ01_LOCUS244351 [marine metagenome]|uniref:Ribosomal RNA small subunit methyltransferase G n=1 Tax=marine metagenome TaxID=408172 RepID=A0A382HX49_9ZZZZ